MARLVLLLVFALGCWTSVQGATTLKLLGSSAVAPYQLQGTNTTSGAGTEQVAFDDKEKYAYMAGTTRLYIIDMSAELLLEGKSPANLPTKYFIDLGVPVNDVSFCGGYVAIAANGPNKNLPGKVIIYRRYTREEKKLTQVANFTVGALPDQLAFSKDCKTILVSNEAEPITYGDPSLVNDPEGSVSVINLAFCDRDDYDGDDDGDYYEGYKHHHRGHYDEAQAEAESVNGYRGNHHRKTRYPHSGYKHDDYEKDYIVDDEELDCRGRRGRVLGKVRTATFTAWNNQRSQLTAQGVKLTGNGTVAQDLEPEYSTFSEDEDIAFVALQENNALGVLNVKTAKFVNVFGLGFKNHSKYPLDVSDQDSQANIATWPVFGMYQPDEIRSFRYKGADYIVIANEGDARDWPGLKEERRVSQIKNDLNATVFGNTTDLTLPAKLGRLNVLTVNGKPYPPFSDPNLTGKFQALYSYGARSFSIFKLDRHGSLSSKGIRLVYDSADDLEQINKVRLIDIWNSDSNNLNNATWDTRSDNKGPEPEGMDIGPCAGYERKDKYDGYYEDDEDEEGRLCLYLGAERMSVIYVFDISNPDKPKFYDVIRPPQSDPTDSATRFVSPEGIAYEKYTHKGKSIPIVLVAYEANPDDPSLISGLGVFRVTSD